jgi:hypothetical protein
MARLSGRLKALPVAEVSDSFAARVVAAVESTYPEQTAIARIVGRLRALPGPDVHPGFARRVVSRIESAGPSGAAVRRLSPGRTAFAAAALAVVVAVAVLIPSNERPGAPVQVAVIETTATEPALPDESTLLARFDARIASDAEVQRIVASRFEPQARPEAIYSDRLLAAFAGSPGLVAGEAYRHGTDYRAALRHFDREQTSALKELLEVSVQEAREG